jgi:hypothetical protein
MRRYRWEIRAGEPDPKRDDLAPGCYPLGKGHFSGKRASFPDSIQYFFRIGLPHWHAATPM